MDMLKAFTRLTDNINGHLDQKIDVEQIMNSELREVMDYGLWVETIDMQKAFNDSVAPGWQLDKSGKKYDFWMAILDESVEVLGSRHWKWWKNTSKHGEVDWDNVGVELVDLFHFILSLSIQHETTEILFSQMVNLQMNKSSLTLVRDDKFFSDFWQNFLMSVQMKNVPLLAVGWVDFWFRMGYDVNDLFYQYRVKAALNKIRQEFGYGVKNAYQKNWLDLNGKEVEDNVMAFKLTQDINLDKNSLDNMIDVLRNYYLTNVSI